KRLEKNLRDTELGRMNLVDDIDISGSAGLLQGSNEDFEITAKKQIGDKTYLNLSYKRSFSLTNPNQSQIGVEYKLSRHFSVVGNIDESGNLNLKYRYRYAY
ncbi:MAG: translocation/assembly module TamB domain-containing protein, partial [Candidatus Neomarinimicrobiota bacterium]|nr:translocation/assembly module TamB domain-containing protein [Candidatus Neomarinimicrobiota bacterium]